MWRSESYSMFFFLSSLLPVVLDPADIIAVVEACMVMVMYTCTSIVCQTGVPTGLATRAHVGKALAVAMAGARSCNGKRSQVQWQAQLVLPCSRGRYAMPGWVRREWKVRRAM